MKRAPQLTDDEYDSDLDYSKEIENELRAKGFAPGDRVDLAELFDDAEDLLCPFCGSPCQTPIMERGANGKYNATFPVCCREFGEAFEKQLKKSGGGLDRVIQVRTK